jgi:hypothetical protein
MLQPIAISMRNIHFILHLLDVSNKPSSYSHTHTCAKPIEWKECSQKSNNKSVFTCCNLILYQITKLSLLCLIETLRKILLDITLLFIYFVILITHCKILLPIYYNFHWFLIILKHACFKFTLLDLNSYFPTPIFWRHMASWENL